MTHASDRCRTFRQLHQSGCFVMPNPWDLGSARLLAQLGFPAIATTSAGFAWSLGRRDNRVSLVEALAHLRSIAQGIEVPVNADFEGGFATAPVEVGANVAAATATGIAGLSIEDSTGDASNPLFGLALAVERIHAAREAIDESGTGVLLTGRSEGFIVGRPDLAETIRRLTAYAEAGADCLYAPGIHTKADIAAVVEAVAPKPVNVLVGGDFATVADLAQAGVRRISVGGALARAAWTGFLQAATEIAERGTFSGRPAPFRSPKSTGALPRWDELAEQWGHGPPPLWRAHSDAVNRRLVERAVPLGTERVLKTDLFDELAGDGLYAFLAERADRVAGIDVAPAVVRAARARHPGLEGAAADVRKLPFPEGSFDAVVSNSTLDHFPSLAEVSASFGELGRVLRKGGTLLVTLDNGANPVIALRNGLPLKVLRRVGLVPYYVGATCGRRRLAQLLDAAGFDTVESGTVMHFPRVVVVLLGKLRGHAKAGATRDRDLRQILRFERLANWLTRDLTGYFAMARAIKR